MTCHKNSLGLPLCSCPECYEDRMASCRAVFIRGCASPQDEYQKDYDEAQVEGWGN
jgi:hypothetical protein